MEPTVIYEDTDLVVLNKPSGLQIHEDNRHDRELLTDWLEKKYGEFFLVHRLDRETSGIIVVARTQEAQEFLKQQFQDRDVRKVYRAFVHGPLKDERGIIERAIGSARGGSAPRSATRPYGRTRDATTVYHRLENGAGVAYVEVFPKTGRTHQIRVHFASLQHPVVGDSLYAPGREKLLGFERLALHAYSITFTHPGGKEMTFEAPLPEDFIAAEAQLRKQ